MNQTIIFIAVSAVLLAGCATERPQDRAAMRVEPAYTIRHSIADAQASYELGRYYAGQKRLDLAERAFRDAIAKDARHVDALNALGALYAERGDLPHALEMFQKVTAIAPSMAYLHNNLGLAYHLMGNEEKAYDALRRAVALDPNLKRGWTNLAIVAKAAGRETPLPQAQNQPQVDRVIAQPDSAAAIPMLKLSRSSNVDAYPLHPVVHQEAVALTVVTADHVATEENGMILLTSAPKPSEKVAPRGLAPRSGARLEVTNGNGITGLARKIGKRLATDQLRLTRITNHNRYSVQRTVIEYQPGFESAAKELAQRLNVEADLRPASAPRSRADLRLVLGKNAASAA